MPNFRLDSKQKIEDFVRGCTFLGTGGGGLPEDGLKALVEELEAGRELGDEWGNICIIKETVNNTLVEKIGKLTSSVAFVLVGNTAYLLKGKQMKECIVPGTLTLAYNTGKAIREAREAGDDPLEAARALNDGWMLFEGIVTRKE